MLGASDIIEPGEFVDFCSPLALSPLNSDLFAAWDFSAGAGSAARNLVRVSHGNLINNPAWSGLSRIPGRGSLLFTAASSQYVSATIESYGSQSTPLTWMTWIYHFGTNATRPVMSLGPLSWWLQTNQKMANVLQFTSIGTSSNSVVATNKWSHIGLTYNGSICTYYLNGEVDGTSTSSLPNSSFGTALEIGKCIDPIFFTGLLSDTIFYKACLSAAAVKAQYEASNRNYPFDRNWISRSVVVGQTGISFDAVSNSGYQAAQSTYSWSHTCSGDNRFLAVDVSLLSAGSTVTSITYNGVALSLIGSQSTVTSFGRVEQWGLANPASGSNTIAVTLSGSIASAGTAVSYAGVHQTSPTESFNSAQATNVGAADATVTVTPVADNCWIHGAVATSDASVTANQTSRNNVTGAGGSAADEDTGPISPATGTAISYTGVGALATWAIGAYAIRPVGATSLLSQDTPELRYHSKRLMHQLLAI